MFTAHPYTEKKKDPNKDDALHCVYYLGLGPAPPPEPGAAPPRGTLNLNPAVEQFQMLVTNWVNRADWTLVWQPGMEVHVKHMKRKDVPHWASVVEEVKDDDKVAADPEAAAAARARAAAATKAAEAASAASGAIGVKRKARDDAEDTGEGGASGGAEGGADGGAEGGAEGGAKAPETGEPAAKRIAAEGDDGKPASTSAPSASAPGDIPEASPNGTESAPGDAAQNEDTTVVKAADEQVEQVEQVDEPPLNDDIDGLDGGDFDGSFGDLPGLGGGDDAAAVRAPRPAVNKLKVSFASVVKKG